MKVAMFPGQGVPAPQVAEALRAGGDVVERAEDLLEMRLRQDVQRVARRGKAVLPTRLAQPAIVVASLALWSQRDDRDTFGCLAGHSLGQFSALVAGRAASLKAALNLVHVRAEAMERAARVHPGGMVALLGVDLAHAEEIATRTGATVANDNCPGQVVLSGPHAALADAAADTRALGGRAVLLQVSGPFHSHAMDAVVPELERALMSTDIRTPIVPLISDVTSRPMAAPGEIRRRLAEQVTHRIDWRGCIVAAEAEGASEFVDIGPGEVLKGLTARCRATRSEMEVTGAH